MIKPRIALIVTIVWATCLSGTSRAAEADRPDPSPNVIFIVADDLNCSLGAYGDPVAVTPNLDRLASRGLVFQRAYCQQAVCNPSRSSFLTGLRPDTVGVDDLRKYFRATAKDGRQLVTLPEHFKNHGYFTQNIGKIFHNMGETQDRRSWSIDEVLYRGTHASDTIFANEPRGGGKPPYKSPVTEAHAVPDTAYRDGQIARLAASVILDQPVDRPFFLAVGFWRPHLPFVAPKRYWDLYDPNLIPAPEPPDAPTEVPEIALHTSREIRNYGTKPKDRVFTPEEIRRFRHGYYASISFLDAQVGRILHALDESPHADNTIVVFTSDHGFHIGEHRLWGKTSNFELDARVPLIIAAPGHAATRGKTTDSLCELIDLYPTLAHLADIEEDLSDRLEGESLAPVLENAAAVVKGAAFTQHPQPYYGPRSNWKAMGRSLRTDRWRYTRWTALDGGEVVARELYDHDSDPHETRNLASHASYRDLIEQLDRQLSREVR
ncbi:Choline-sulfatase [Planctomycetes bacterium Pan216]|uniref:Choline-sulfatase n=1 Tax=Kolteria novifilia TaxID=2527975 RepID=A0A518B4T4_9BACT|nr:Choline-sulfatase [Planctomycetes bacterium Pan216]